MSMLKATDPRRVYSRNEVIHVCYGGLTFGPPDGSKIKLDTPVKIVGNGDGTVSVTQRKPKQKGITESWSKVRVPCNSR